jgi:Fe-S cluster assembly ATP-binding protein
VSVLSIRGLRAAVAGREVLRGIDLEVRSGEVHAVMGPNGAGKSTLGNVLMGRPGYTVLEGSASIDGFELLDLPTFERARAGLFLAPQDPTELPGVPLAAVLAEALAGGGTRPLEDAASLSLAPGGAGGLAATPLDIGRWLVREAAEIGLAEQLLERGLNVDASGGERKRLETLQLAVLRPRFAVLDELDSGLDVDALRAVARRVEAQARGVDGRDPLGVLVITHYRRILDLLRPDVVHVLVDGTIVDRGGPELAEELERTGYAEHHRPGEEVPVA